MGPLPRQSISVLRDDAAETSNALVLVACRLKSMHSSAALRIEGDQASTQQQVSKWLAIAGVLLFIWCCLSADAVHGAVMHRYHLAHPSSWCLAAVAMWAATSARRL